MDRKIISVDLHSTTKAVGVWQYDYGQILRIQGGNLPKTVEVHFSLDETGGESITRIGTTRDGVTEAPVPDSMLENNDCEQNYSFYAYVYVRDETSGNTEHKITIHVKARSKPEIHGDIEEPQLFGKMMKNVNEAAERAERAELSSEAWARGHENYPEREKDNAMYYAGKAKEAVKEISGEVKDAKNEIDHYVEEKEATLKGEPGNVHFAAFKVVDGRLKMYSAPDVDKVRFRRTGSRLKYRLNF